MKRLKLFLVAMALFVASSASAAGLEWGLMAGISRADFSVKGDSDNLADKAGYTIGLSLKADLPMIDIGPEIMYTRNTMTVESNKYFGTAGNGGKIKSNSIDVPVVAALNIMGPLQIEVGPTFSLYSEANAKYDDHSYSLGRFKSEVGYLVGAKITVLGTLIVGARFYSQFQPMKVTTDTGSYDIQQYSYSISVGANF